MEIGDHSSLCLVQISRTGDLLQTLEAIAPLKVQFPHIKLTLVARKCYADPILFLLEKSFDHLFLLDLPSLSKEHINPGLNDFHHYLHDFIKDVNLVEYTHCFNITFSPSSAYLTGLIKAEKKKGLIRNSKGELNIPDSWSQLIYGVLMCGPHIPFNLVDLFKAIFGLPLVENYSKTDYTSATPHIFIHPFASQKRKHWAISKWGECCGQLLLNYPELKLTFIGSGDEAPFIEDLINTRLLNFKERIHNSAGKLTIEAIHEELKTATLFIGHDSMGGHLAAIQHVPTITISLGPVRPHETTPYGEGMINLVPRVSCFPCAIDKPCESQKCHENISPYLVATLAGYFLRKEVPSYDSLLKSLSFLHLTTVDIMQSYFKNGQLKLRNLSGHHPTLNTVFKEFYFVLWNFVLRQEEVGSDIPQIGGDLLQTLHEYLQGLDKCFRLIQFAQDSCQKILDQLLKKGVLTSETKGELNKIQEIDQLFMALKQPYPLLSPVIDYYFVGRANLGGHQMVRLLTQSLMNYQEFFYSLQILQEFIQTTLAPNRANQPQAPSQVSVQHDN